MSYAELRLVTTVEDHPIWQCRNYISSHALKKYLVGRYRGCLAFLQFQDNYEGVLTSQTISTYAISRLAGLHTITRQLCQLRLDHTEFHHEGAEVLT